MDYTGRILLADDEEVFLNSTADLLRKEGYFCDCVKDGPSALVKLGENAYDVLVADIKMPGNPDLEMIQQVKNMHNGLQVILVTGFPSMASAIKSIGLPVVAYLVKPIEFSDLLSQIRNAIERSRILTAVRATQEQLKEWQGQLDRMQHLMQEEPGNPELVPVDTFITVTLHNIVWSLNGLKNVTEALAELSGKHDVCQLMDCPRVDSLTAALNDTIGVLRKSKSAFKSKELGELRKRLEQILEA
jgi:CheY-like chemotaxis protein